MFKNTIPTKYFLLFVCACLFLFSNAYAQINFDTTYFRNPMNLPMNLSGNFGELRNNHFHSGLDIRTEQEEGKPVFSVADGYVSRIKVSGYGYGNALYITHPNGLVSVYGHLQSYCDSVTKYLRKQQYRLELFEVDLELNPTQLPVKKGQLIGLSGNTGGSEAPHLHFEIRDQKTEWALNPLKYGFTVKDTCKPSFSEIIIYPINEASSVNQKNTPLKINVKKRANGDYYLEKPEIEVHGIIGFGLNGFDTENESFNKNGLYKIELIVGNESVFSSTIEKFAFDQTKQINAHIDFYRKKSFGEMLQRCFVLPGNTLPFYNYSKTRGLFNFNKDTTYEVKFIIGDVYGNSVELKINVKSSSQVYLPEIDLEKKKFSDYFYYNVKNSFKRPEIQIEIPKGALFEDLEFYFDKKDSLKYYYSPIYQIHYDNVPLYKPIQISIKAKKLPPNLRSKAGIVTLGNGSRLGFEPGEWDENFMGIRANLKTFGRFALMIDTTKPNISLIKKKAEKNVIPIGKSISFRVTDNLSGVKKIRTTIDGKWVLYDHDGKTNKIKLIPDERYPNDEKEHLLQIEITDGVGNTKVYKSKIKLLNRKNIPVEELEEEQIEEIQNQEN